MPIHILPIIMLTEADNLPRTTLNVPLTKLQSKYWLCRNSFSRTISYTFNKNSNLTQLSFILATWLCSHSNVVT
jgi:hypothetical protein